MRKRSPFRYFKTSPEIIRLAVMLYIRFPLSPRNVEDLLHEWGTDICHETVRFWWHRFGPMIAAEIRKRRLEGMRLSRWKWHLDEVFVTINGERHYLWRAIDHISKNLWVKLNGVVIATVAFTTAGNGQFQSNRALGFLARGGGTLQFIGEVETLKVWLSATGTGAEPVVAPLKSVAGPAVTANADGWKLGSNAT